MTLTPAARSLFRDRPGVGVESSVKASSPAPVHMSCRICVMGVAWKGPLAAYVLFCSLSQVAHRLVSSPCSPFPPALHAAPSPLHAPAPPHPPRHCSSSCSVLLSASVVALTYRALCTCVCLPTSVRVVVCSHHPSSVGPARRCVSCRSAHGRVYVCALCLQNARGASKKPSSARLGGHRGSSMVGF